MSASTTSPRSGAFAVVQSLASKVLFVGINAGTGILTARTLKPEGRGELAAAILWPLLLASVMTLGIPSSLIYNIRRNREHASRLVGAALALAACISLIAIAIGYVGLPHWLHHYPAYIVTYAREFLLAVPFTAAVLIGRAALESDGHFGASNATLWASQLPTLLVLAALAATHHMTVYTAALAYVLGGVPISIWMLARIVRIFRPRLKAVVPAAKNLLSYGVRSYGVDLCGTLALYVDQALVVALLAPDAMGTYVVALSLSRLLNVVQQSVVMVLFPKAAAQESSRVVELTGQAARITTAVTAALGLGVVILGPILLRLLYGAEYASAASLLRVLIVEVTISGCTIVLAQAFMALGRPGVVTILQCTGLGLSVPLMLVLIPGMGTLGAAVALMLSTCARFVLTLFSFRYFLHCAPPRMWLNRSDLEFIFRTIHRERQGRRPQPPVGLEATVEEIG